MSVVSFMPSRSASEPGLGRRSEQAELRLVAAVLEDAIRIVAAGAASPAYRRRAVFAETIEWIASDDLRWPFSFRNLCVALQVDALHLRAAITCSLRAATHQCGH